MYALFSPFPCLGLIYRRPVSLLFISFVFFHADLLTEYHRLRVHSSSEETCTKAYFEYFHPSFPIVHRPTFSATSAPNFLVKATALIGSLFPANSLHDGPETQGLVHCRRTAWRDEIEEELQQIVRCENPLYPMAVVQNS